MLVQRPATWRTTHNRHVQQTAIDGDAQNSTEALNTVACNNWKYCKSALFSLHTAWQGGVGPHQCCQGHCCMHCAMHREVPLRDINALPEAQLSKSASGSIARREGRRLQFAGPTCKVHSLGLGSCPSCHSSASDDSKLPTPYGTVLAGGSSGQRGPLQRWICADQPASPALLATARPSLVVPGHGRQVCQVCSSAYRCVTP